jgi:endonuclease YncB( thermonuclease family)
MVCLFTPASFAICALLLFFPYPIKADDFSGVVVGVLDGDTIEVLHNNHAERIRLNGIHCPEKRQPYGTKAKQATSDLGAYPVTKGQKLIPLIGVSGIKAC